MSDALIHDCACVGAGIVGMTAALALAELGYRVAVIEPNQDTIELPPPYDPRSYAITEASINVFTNLGVWPLLDGDRNADILSMQVWDGSSKGGIDFSPERVFASRFGVITEHANLAHALDGKITNHPRIQTYHSGVTELSSVKDGRWLQLTDGTALNVGLVVCADGSRSKMRSLLGLEASEKSYNQRALVCNIESTEPHDNIARQVFLSGGPLAFLPLAHPNQSAIVWTNDEHRCGELMVNSDQSLAAAVEQAIGYRLGAIKVVSKRFDFPLHKMHVRRYDAERAVLVGDAAHVVHPLAGQGLNLGIMDVATLANTLAPSNLVGGLGSARLPAALRRYSRCRAHENGLMLRATDALNSLFSRRESLTRSVRGLGLNLVGKTPPLMDLFTRHALGYGGETPPLARPAT